MAGLKRVFAADVPAIHVLRRGGKDVNARPSGVGHDGWGGPLTP